MSFLWLILGTIMGLIAGITICALLTAERVDDLEVENKRLRKQIAFSVLERTIEKLGEGEE